MKIGFIGCGKMGQAILKGMLSRNANAQVFAYDKFCDLSKFVADGMHICNNAAEVVEKSDAIVLAVKPQDMQAVLDEIKQISEHKLFVSIAAGLQTDFFESNLLNSRVIRVMPNLAITVEDMAGAYCLGKTVEEKDKEVLKEIFGEHVLLIEVQENLMHAVTALTSSGMAFTAFLINAFVEAAEKEGLDKKDALLLAEKTFFGTANLLMQENIYPDQLVKDVTSKAGTTEAGLKVMQESELKNIIEETVSAAVKRSKELSE